MASGPAGGQIAVMPFDTADHLIKGAGPRNADEGWVLRRPVGTPCARVFISYVWAGSAQREQIEEFWRFLRSCGVDARLDLPAMDGPRDWPAWIEEQVLRADFVLVIASGPDAADGRAGRRGRRWEMSLLRAAAYLDRDRALSTVLPVVLPGGSIEGLPLWLAPGSCTTYLVRDFTVEGSEALLRYVTAQPLVTEPPVGRVPHLPTRTGRSHGVEHIEKEMQEGR